MDEREQIAELTARLRAEHDEYERAAESWTTEAGEKKRELRKARARTLHEIEGVLERLGEAGRVEEIARQPYEQKLAMLEALIAEAGAGSNTPGTVLRADAEALPPAADAARAPILQSVPAPSPSRPSRPSSAARMAAAPAEGGAVPPAHVSVRPPATVSGLPPAPQSRSSLPPALAPVSVLPPPPPPAPSPSVPQIAPLIIDHRTRGTRLRRTFLALAAIAIVVALLVALVARLMARRASSTEPAALGGQSASVEPSPVPAPQPSAPAAPESVAPNAAPSAPPSSVATDSAAGPGAPPPRRGAPVAHPRPPAPPKATGGHPLARGSRYKG